MEVKPGICFGTELAVEVAFSWPVSGLYTLAAVSPSVRPAAYQPPSDQPGVGTGAGHCYLFPAGLVVNVRKDGFGSFRTRSQWAGGLLPDRDALIEGAKALPKNYFSISLECLCGRMV